ncbi:hypothetical protein TcCL_NonESM09109 [Trypanosoma cruzi]|nr:hypothetical protein TcCL_NonESM09109 [Trypanosoma cruzi]
MHVAGGVSEGNPRKEEWHAFGGAAVRSAGEEEKQVISDASVGVPRPPMSSQGGKGGRETDAVHIHCGVWCDRMRLPLRRVQRPSCVQQASSASLCLSSLQVPRGGAGDLSSLGCWGSFLLYSAGEATLPAGAVLFCIDTPHVVSRRRVVAVQLALWFYFY